MFIASCGSVWSNTYILTSDWCNTLDVHITGISAFWYTERNLLPSLTIRRLCINLGGKDREALFVVLGRDRENARVDRFVQVEHQPRNESNGHAGGMIKIPLCLSFIAPITHQLVNVARPRLPLTTPWTNHQKIFNLRICRLCAH
jgi:hypothetical protein